MWGIFTGHFNFFAIFAIFIKNVDRNGVATRARGWERLPPHTHTPPGPFDEVRDLVQQVEGVVGVSTDLRHRPDHQEQYHTLLTLDLNTVSR